MQNFGIDVEQMQKAVIEMSLYKGVFKEGDKAYLDGVTPEGETVNGEKARGEELIKAKVVEEIKEASKKPSPKAKK